MRPIKASSQQQKAAPKRIGKGKDQTNAEKAKPPLEQVEVSVIELMIEQYFVTKYNHQCYWLRCWLR